MTGGHDWLSALWAVLWVAIILGMAYWVTRRLAGRGLPLRRRNGTMELLAQELLGRDQRLVLVRVGTRYYLLGVTLGSVSLVAELSREDAAAMEPPEQDSTGSPSFFEAFSEVLKQKTRR